ncbi:hypothetical protein Salat_2114200 [Sesamum alatum]|uniref:Uncharacterized protein n=1 Tax=Sesamum alatum TaxID=300844 RepID=A0AAE1Y1P4_9LAMI|nr:hypothetical protein Salat_2114200 [Sesamum alatum]
MPPPPLLTPPPPPLMQPPLSLPSPPPSLPSPLRAHLKKSSLSSIKFPLQGPKPLLPPTLTLPPSSDPLLQNIAGILSDPSLRDGLVPPQGLERSAVAAPSKTTSPAFLAKASTSTKLVEASARLRRLSRARGPCSLGSSRIPFCNNRR